MQINKLLAKFIRDSTSHSSHLFKKHTELCYLVKPNHLIIKPIFAVMVLKHTMPPVPAGMDWNDYPSLHKIWAKVKNQLKQKDFIKSLQEFDIRTVRKQDVDLIRKMYEGDIWMQQEMVDRHKGIAAESGFALQMHRWANKIIEFISVVQSMDQIGIVEIETKIQKLLHFKNQILALLALSKSKKPFQMFNELRTKKEIAQQLL